MPDDTEVNALPLPDLFARFVASGLVARVIDLAFDEDLGRAGDVTSLACIPEDRVGVGRLVARGGGVIAGLAALPLVRDRFAPGLHLRIAHRDATPAAPGTLLAELTGPLRAMLAMERTALNLVGRLSGVATRTAAFVGAMPPASRAAIYDTRKTTPGLRVLEKYAVRCGGGRCHRLGLHDAMLIKDNHLAGVGTAELAAFVQGAASRARAMSPVAFVQVEVDTLDQFEALLALPPGVVDIVLLDNMTPADLAHAARRRDARAPRLELEASGGVTLATLPAIATSGVDRISVGGITHQAVSLDVALDVEPG
ncbi:MAG: carboxylating nicotinate-nucleotide diphosphorylase [Planctomycetota bacterium]|nr:carboxylating nicotinate-nucleotide diphosphorylase [Planctomycetota bacterium]